MDWREEWQEEPFSVITNRFLEARRAGLSHIEARLFAESEIDVGLLRKLVKAKFPPEEITNQLF